MKRKKKLYLSIFNYNNKVVCDIYDNQSNVSGQAVNVHINNERNGWRELNFDIPSSCNTEDGPQQNYRLNYLISEYKIRSVEDDKMDWFIISEPQIKHNNFSKTVSVKAGHISQILKHKNLDLEFSDEEGNNVGTAEQLLSIILQGTGFLVGHVGEQNEQGVWHTFLEDDGTAKQRSLTGPAGTGALAFIEKLCDTFEAKPVYRCEEDGNYVDVVPMNPFAKIEPEQIPYIARDRDLDVLELYYDRNLHSLTKTCNTDNMATRLYAYGSSGDMNGICTLQNAIHYEFTMTAPETREGEYRFEVGNLVYYFQADLAQGDELVWSTMDITSSSYVYNNTQEIAYRVYKTPKTSSINNLTVSEPVEKTNDFAFLLGLQYYDNVGLMTEEQFQAIARFQRDMPAFYAIIRDASKNYIKSESDLSRIANPGNGMLKLKISEIVNNQYIIDTSVGENGVIYRTDYDKAERRYFKWNITKKLNEFGDPIIGTNPSLLYIVHGTNPVTYDLTYLKCVWDINGAVLDDENEPKNFEYSTGNHPVSFTVWDNDIRFNPQTDKVYLFCTNSISGSLGSRLSAIESVYMDLYNATMKHPTTFYDGDDQTLVIPAPTNTEYEWRYDYHTNRDGELYFCWADKFNDNSWHRVYISEEEPSGVNDGYLYNERLKSLSRWNNSEWVKIEDKQTIVAMFESVIFFCRQRDQLFRGIYQYYYHDYPKSVNNYAISDGHSQYWTFKLKTRAENNILFDSVGGQVYSDVTFDGDKPVYNINSAVRASTVESRSVTLPSDNEIRDRIFYPGTLNLEGVEVSTIDTNYRTGFIDVANNQTYDFSLPTGTSIFFYNQNKEYTRNITPVPTQSPENAAQNPTVTGTFVTSGEVYIRVVVPGIGLNMLITPTNVAGAESLLKDRPFINGSIGYNGLDVDTNSFRTYNINAYENTTYEYSLPESCIVFYYDMYLTFIGLDTLTTSASAGNFVTPANTRFFRLVSSTNNMDAYYVRVKDYDKIFYMNREAYYIIPTVGLGDLLGITPLTEKFSELADEAYENYLPTLEAAQKEVKNAENTLAILLGDMLKDGRWQDANYIFGDEKRLYDDSMYMLKQISEPETSYSFTFLDRYGIQNESYYEAHPTEFQSVNIAQIAHLVDPEANANCWAYMDKVDQWYDQEWKTTVDIDTKLTLASRHSFTDVIARIAEVAKEMKAKQALYDNVATGSIDGSRLEGAIDISRTYLNSGISNWYSDSKGNLVFEATDGMSAMQLGGRGLAIATERSDNGEWLWRTAATGFGLAADTITTGTLNADRINAGTITLDKLASNVGKELEISSNSALMLFATEDGTRPAGSLKTTDGYIEVKAGQGNTPAKINIVSGGELNLNGGKVNVFSEGEMNISSGGRFVLQSQGANSIDSTAQGLFIDSDVGVNFGGGKFKVKRNGSAMEVTMKANYIELGDTNSAYVVMDSASRTIDIGALAAINLNSDTAINLTSNNIITLSANRVLQLLTNGQVQIGKQGHPFIIGGDNNRSYLYYGLSSLSGTSDGVYVGTDGFGLKQTNNGIQTSFIAQNGNVALKSGSNVAADQNFVSISATGTYRIWAGHPTASSAPFYVKKDGTIKAAQGNIGGFTMTANQFNCGSGSTYTAINTDTTINPNQSGRLLHEYLIWAGNETDLSAPFSVKKDGSLYSVKGNIAGWEIQAGKLFSGSGTSYVEINSDNASSYAMWCGHGTASSAPFYVMKDGTFKATSATISGNVTITGGSITIQNSQQTQTFSVTDQGVLTANKGTIAGWSINPDLIGKILTAHSHSYAQVGMASTSGDTKNAFWAGANVKSSGTGSSITYSDNMDGTNAKFRVQNNGTLYATGAYLNEATITGGSFTTQNSNNETTFEITTDGKIKMKAGWYIDPNDFSGPYINNSVKTSSTGFINLNCNDASNAANNPRISVGPQSGGKSPFRVYQDGALHISKLYRGDTDAFIITSLSTSSITGYSTSGASVTANFFNSSQLGVGTSGNKVYPTYNGNNYTTNQKTLSISLGSWSEGVCTATVKVGNTSTTASTNVSIPATSDSGYQNQGNGYWKGWIEIGGTKRWIGTTIYVPSYTSYGNGMTSLYYYNTQNLRYEVATGSAKYWYYV